MEETAKVTFVYIEDAINYFILLKTNVENNFRR